MKVTRLPVDPGPAGWNEILPAADAAPASRDFGASPNWFVKSFKARRRDAA